MALEVREGSFKVSSRPSSGYLLGVPVVASNKLALVNDYTKDRRSGKLQPPLTPDRNRRGTRGTKVSRNPRLASAPRVLSP